MSAEHDGADALMTAITGDPLPPGAREDAAFLAEHRAAEADLAVLREQLGVIGRALAEPPPAAPAPAPAPVRPVRAPARPRRRAFTLALGGLAVTAAASVMAGLGWLIAGGAGEGDSASADAGSAAEKQSDAAAAPAFGSPRYLACSRLVAEGEATAVERLPGTSTVRITLRLTRTYHPDGDAPGDKPGAEQVFVVDDSVVPGIRAGDPVLVGVPRDARQPDFWAVGERDIAPERAGITAALPEARGLACG
ncbi:hypothetical protein [Streptomyces sp. KAU_LT]|uniref:hypothetical protein n=1 Tax=Streptomyces sp. KAU_LT TaxID=3046669 RepID=UPI0024B71B7F|nr:hypothetical protein [Streptomyces sp. KAU_LT]MDI9834801.1 hypothetical protein [Streptomyces sp. KAU_LT]